jgi:succinate-semialdehyde dehydrogenase/glutarate-semialdehyde dehydrogenase
MTIESAAMPQTDERYGDIQLFIGGQLMGNASDRREIINPATGQVVGSSAIAQDSDLEAALESARLGFEIWRKTPATDRSAVLARAAMLIRERVAATAMLLTLEQGKPLRHAKMEMIGCAETFEWYSGQALRINGSILPPRKGGARQLVLPEPIGPVLALAPWNFPALLSARKIAPALAAGCSCILKPSEETPAAALSLALALKDAGLPDGVLNVVFGVPSEISERLILSPVIRKVSLTGSVLVGRIVAGLAAQGPKPCTLELGGHAPVLVLHDADIAFTSKVSAASKTFNAGQVCTSPTRFIVHESVFDEFLKTFADDLNKTVVGDGLDPKTRMGPLVNTRRIDIMTELVDDAVSGGARVVAGGSRTGKTGNFWQPTLLADVSSQAKALRQEPFGPLATVEKFASLDDCIKTVNESQVGLAGYVFSRSASAALDASEQLDVGMVGINSYALSNTESPFSGVKSSGYGYEGGTEALASYLHYKAVNLA